jgi:hypothetical protein
MPDRKQLLQDFYTKYAPDEELTDERLAAIDAKYMGNDRQLLLDFYAKYAPDQELTDERYNAITTKYGLGKQPASPSGSGAASSSAQSAQQPEPSEPSGATSDPVQQEIDRLQSKYESALKTNSNWLTDQENQQLIKLKKSQQAVGKNQGDVKKKDIPSGTYTPTGTMSLKVPDLQKESANMQRTVADNLKGISGEAVAKVASMDREILKIDSKIRQLESNGDAMSKREGGPISSLYQKKIELLNKQLYYINPSLASTMPLDESTEALSRTKITELTADKEKEVRLYESQVKAGEVGAEKKLAGAKKDLDALAERQDELDKGIYSPGYVPTIGDTEYDYKKPRTILQDVPDLYSQFDVYKIQERSKLASEINLDPDSPVVRGMSVQAMRDMHSKKMQEVAEYQKYAPNAFKNINLDELLLESKKKGGGLISELRAEGNVDRAFRTLESDFMMYLNGTNPSRYSQYKSRMDEIDYKRNNGQQLSYEEEDFASSFTKEALQFRQLSDLKAARDIESTMDMRTFQLDGQRMLYDMKNVEKQIKDQSKLLNISGDENIVKYNKYKDEMTPIGQGLQNIEAQLKPFMAQDGSMRQDLNPTEAVKAQELIDQYNIASEKAKEVQSRYSSIFDENGNLVPGVNSKKLQGLYEQYNTLTKDYDKVQQTTGVTEDKLNSLNNTYTSLGQSKLAYEFIDKDYWRSNIQKDFYEKSKAERNRIAKEGTYSEKAGVLFDTMGSALATSVFSIAQAPKVTLEALGGAGSNAAVEVFAERLYDFSTDLNTIFSESGTSITEGSSAFKFMNKTAEAFGSYATSILFGGVGGLAVKGLSGGAKMMKAAQVTSGFMQGYLMSQGDAYRQALKSGMSEQEAGVVANMVGVMSGIGESLFNEIDVFNPAQRYSLGSLIREKGFEDGVTAWAPQYVKSIFNEAAPEFLEESASEVLNQAVNNAVNGVVGREVLHAGWNMSAVVESGISGSLPPAFLGVMKFGTKYRTPQEQATLRNMGENGADIQVAWANSGATVEEMKDLGELTKLANELNNIPSYAELTGDNKDRVFNLIQLKNSIVDARKETGLLPLDKEDIESIDKEIMSIYEQDKIIKETAAQPAPEPTDVGTDVMSGLVTTVYPTVGKVETMMEGEEFVNDKDIATAEDNLYTLLDDIDKREDLTDQQKLSMSRVIEERIQKIENYEYRSKTKSSTATQARAAGTIEKARAANERAANPVRTAAAEGIPVAYNGMKGTMKMSDGKMVDNVGDTIPEGNYVFVPEGTNNRAGRKGAVVVGSQEDIDSNAEFVNTESNPSWAPDQNNVANMKLPNGDTLSIMDDDLSVDVGLKAAEQTIGLAPQAMFDTVFEEVSKEFNVEQPYLKSDDQKNKQGVSGGVGGQQTTVQNQPDQGTGTETTTPSGVVQGTQEVDFDGAPAITIEEETDNAAAYDDAMMSVIEFDDTLEGDDLDTATAFVQMGATPEEAVGMIREEKEAIEQASKGAEFNPKSSKKVAALVQKKASFATVVKQGGKKYVVVGLKLATSRKNKTAGRDNYSFASYELNENTPSNIVEILEKQAKENFKNIYPDFSDSDVIKPIATTEAFTIPKAAEKQQPVAETATTKPGEYTPSRKTELKDKYKGQPKAAVLEYLDKAARAFRKTFGKDTPVFVFETAREMHDALVAQGRNEDFNPKEGGAFAYDEDGNVYGIYINMENADAAVAPHEFVHNVLLEVFGQDPEVYAKFRDKVLEMFEGSTIDRLKKWAEENYNKESSPEEFITELTAQLAVTDKELELPTTLVDKFKDIVNSVFRSVSGMNVFSDRATKKDVVEFINAMASGLAAGRAIDLQAGKRLAKERAKELAKSRPVSKAKVREQSRRSASQIAGVDAAQASAMSVDDRIMAGRLRDQIAATNPDLDFIIDNFDKIEKAMVKEGKLKVNCEL